MQTWLMIFSIVASLALVVQGAMLIALFFEVRQTNKKVNGLVTDLHTRVGPILTRAQILLDDTQPKISSMVADAAHIVYLTRGQAQKMDRVLTDATDRLAWAIESRGPNPDRRSGSCGRCRIAIPKHGLAADAESFGVAAGN